MEKEPVKQKEALVDSYGRVIDYLRISVTDRCNLKCIYCHPPHKIEHLSRSNICSYEELAFVARAASELGIEKIRVTGGEPFSRADLPEFMESLHEIEQIREITLTTNGTMLLPHIKKLKEAGVRRINVSLDTLSRPLYSRITGSDGLAAVLDGIDKALDEGFHVKVNMVVLKGINETEIPSFIRYFSKNDVEVRFIEFMPLCGPAWKDEYFFPYEKIKDFLRREFDLRPLSLSGAAREFALSDGNGLKGKAVIIAAVTRPFCSSCSKIRLSANGRLRPCLFSSSAVEILPILRENISLEKKEKRVQEAFKQAVSMKPSCRSGNNEDRSVYIHTIGG
jgi:cyclic pyranopterin phosphate synthase